MTSTGLKHGETALLLVLLPGGVVPGVVVVPPLVLLPGVVVPDVVLPDGLFPALPPVDTLLLSVPPGDGADVTAGSSPPPPHPVNTEISRRLVNFSECVFAFMKDSLSKSSFGSVLNPVLGSKSTAKASRQYFLGRVSTSAKSHDLKS